MIKKALFAIVPAFLLVATVNADDNLLDDFANLDASQIEAAEMEVESFDLDVDMDELAANAGEETDAIEACFRRFGYRSYGYGYRSYYHNCYRPVYYSSYHCYRPVYRVSYHCVTPIYRHYWGCW